MQFCVYVTYCKTNCLCEVGGTCIYVPLVCFPPNFGQSIKQLLEYTRICIYYRSIMLSNREPKLTNWLIFFLCKWLHGAGITTLQSGTVFNFQRVPVLLDSFWSSLIVSVCFITKRKGKGDKLDIFVPFEDTSYKF